MLLNSSPNADRSHASQGEPIVETHEPCTPSQMGLELAEISRLDLACNLEDWRRAVMSAARTRENSPVWMPRDWALEVHIALNCLLLMCVRDVHGPSAMLLLRHAIQQTFLEQVAASGASPRVLERLERLQAARFGALDELAQTRDSGRARSLLIERLIAGVAGSEALAREGASKLEVSFEEFRAAMTRRVASYALAEAIAR